MKKHIIFVHGGQSYSRYEAFLEHLRTAEIEDPFEVKAPIKKWKYTLGEALAGTHDVLYPKMPNSDNAKYVEWKLWFERYLNFVHDEVILIGHSQGGCFLAKYLSEEKFSVRIRAVYLVAAPYSPDDFGGEDGGDFLPSKDTLPYLQQRTKSLFIVHSVDDPIVPYSHAECYLDLLPEAQHIRFDDRGHFNMEEFPEIIENIRHLD